MMTTAAAAGDGSTAATSSQQSSKDGDFKRKLSKREKKAIKKQEKLNKANKDKDGGSTKDGESSVAEKLYTGELNFRKIILFHFNRLRSYTTTSFAERVVIRK